MAQIAIVLVCLGIIGVIYGVVQKLKAGRVADAPFVKTGEAAGKGAAVANAKGAISAEGNVMCAQPLVSPVTGVPCLYYHLKVTASWKDGDREKMQEITNEKRAAAFTIDDGTGPVRVEAREGGDFEPTQSKDETKGLGLIGGLAGKDLQFGNYRVSAGITSIGTKYRVEERVLPVVPRLYACGKVGSSNEITAPGLRNLILSNKSRDDLLAHATQGAKMFLGGGAASSVVGIALAVIASLTAPPATADAKPAPVATSTAAPAPAPAETSTATTTSAAHQATPAPAHVASTRPAAATTPAKPAHTGKPKR